MRRIKRKSTGGGGWVRVSCSRAQNQEMFQQLWDILDFKNICFCVCVCVSAVRHQHNLRLVPFLHELCSRRIFVVVGVLQWLWFLVYVCVLGRWGDFTKPLEVNSFFCLVWSDANWIWENNERVREIVHSFKAIWTLVLGGAHTYTHSLLMQLCAHRYTGALSHAQT